MEMYNDAANQLVRLTGHLPELYSAVISEHAGNIYGKARMRRRMALNLVLAGHRYSKAEQMTLAMRSYEKALPEYFEKGWCFAEDHCLNVIARHSEDRPTAAECSAKVLRAYSAQSTELLSTFLAQYVTTMRAVGSEPSQFVLPLVDCRRIRVIRGEHPRVFPPVETIIEASTSQTADEADAISWGDIERAAYQALGYDQPFKPLLLLSDETTDNTELQYAPPNERFRVQISLRNPLSIPLLLRRLRLSVKQEASQAGISCDSQAIDEVTIPPYSGQSESQKEGSANTHEVTLELSATPAAPAETFVVDKLLFDVVAPGTSETLASYLPLEIPGRRLFATKQQRLKKTYAPDRRLEARVSSAPWPLLDFNFSGNAAQQSHVNAFCNQLYQILLDVQNAGMTEVTGLTMATDRPGLVSLSEKDPSSLATWRLCEAALSPTDQRILCHSVLMPKGISPGQKLSLRLSLRAPPTPVNNFPVSVVFYYVDANGGQRHFNYRLLLSTQTLLHAEAKVIDSADGLCALQVRNVLSSKDSALAKVELLRLSSLVRTEQGAEPPSVAVKLVNKRPVSIESEQTEMCCFYLTTDESHTFSSVWLSEATVDIPKWSHLIASSRLTSTYDAQDSERTAPQIAHLRMAVLWKATIANAGGTVGTILGETLLPNPFVDASNPGKLLFLPGSQSNWAFALTDEERKDVERHMTRSRSEVKFQIPWSVPQDALLDGEQVGEDASVAVQCRLHCQAEPILHDFSSNKMCKFRVRLHATNVDPLRRRCSVLVNVTLHDFLLSASGSSARPTSSLSYSAPLSSGLFANLSVTRRVLPFGSSETFTIAFCTLNSGVYDVASCIEAFAIPDGSDRQTRLSLPSCSVTVKELI
ncbi:Protein F46F11.9 a [Aphelenchoides avenae]|nr:Protein F46F11.9 a [Aphelenchus avenae]